MLEWPVSVILNVSGELLKTDVQENTVVEVM